MRSSVSNDILREGWQAMRSCQDLSEATGASEIEVARQFMRLGIAENTREVAVRLGCDPTGTLAGRVRLAEDRTASAVWVLIVDGVRGAPPFARPQTEGGPFPRHVSVHIDYDEADLALNQLVLDHIEAGGSVEEIAAHIAERIVGEVTDVVAGNFVLRLGAAARHGRRCVCKCRHRTTVPGLVLQ